MKLRISTPLKHGIMVRQCTYAQNVKKLKLDTVIIIALIVGKSSNGIVTNEHSYPQAITELSK